MRRLRFSVLSAAIVAVALGPTASADPRPTAIAQVSRTAPRPATVPGKDFRWLALGDSFSSGEGVTDNVGECAQSPNAYALVAATITGVQRPADGLAGSVDFVACTGAQTVEAGTSNDLDEQLSKATGRYDLITFTFGGNDIGFADIVADCIGWEGSIWNPTTWGCSISEKEVSERIDSLLRKRLREAYLKVARFRANGGKVVVLGYPALVEDPQNWSPETPGNCELFRPDDTRMLRRQSEHLNRVIAEAAEDFKFEFLDIRPGFEGHNLCANKGFDHEWINGISTGHGSESRFLRKQHSYHPKYEGHYWEGFQLANRIHELPFGASKIHLSGGGFAFDTSRYRFGTRNAFQVERTSSIFQNMEARRIANTCQDKADGLVVWYDNPIRALADVPTFAVTFREFNITDSPIGMVAGGIPVGYRWYKENGSIQPDGKVRLRSTRHQLDAFAQPAGGLSFPSKVGHDAGQPFRFNGALPGPTDGNLTDMTGEGSISELASGVQCGLSPLAKSDAPRKPAPKSPGAGQALKPGDHRIFFEPADDDLSNGKQAQVCTGVDELSKTPACLRPPMVSDLGMKVGSNGTVTGSLSVRPSYVTVFCKGANELDPGKVVGWTYERTLKVTGTARERSVQLNLHPGRLREDPTDYLFCKHGLEYPNRLRVVKHHRAIAEAFSGLSIDVPLKKQKDGTQGETTITVASIPYRIKLF